MPAGKVTLRVRNTGRLLHNVPFADQAIDRDIAPGDSATITVTMRKESLRFVCKNHSAAGMVGALVPAYPEGLRREPALLRRDNGIAFDLPGMDSPRLVSPVSGRTARPRRKESSLLKIGSRPVSRAFEEVLAENLDAPFRTALRFCDGHEADAEDLLQDATLVEYTIRGHPLSYYVFAVQQAQTQTDEDVRVVSRDGYRVAVWEEPGVGHASVADISSSQILVLARYCIRQRLARSGVPAPIAG